MLSAYVHVSCRLTLSLFLPPSPPSSSPHSLSLSIGWIHGVYTPKQSLVFGGNFLLSLHIYQQLTVAYMERDLKVRERERELLLYEAPFALIQVIQYYNSCYCHYRFKGDSSIPFMVHCTGTLWRDTTCNSHVWE